MSKPYRMKLNSNEPFADPESGSTLVGHTYIQLESDGQLVAYRHTVKEHLGKDSLSIRFSVTSLTLIPVHIPRFV